uniref:UDENN domain-containing protein n=1 Tax=Hydatigena taeniaeformis TaxID=6205 RepID=A0A0R3WVW3_HYDTA
LVRIPNWPALVEDAICLLRGPSQRTPKAALPPALAIATTPCCATGDDLLAMAAVSPTKGRSRSPAVRLQAAHPSISPRSSLLPNRSASVTPRTAVFEPPTRDSSGCVFQGQLSRRSSIDRFSHLIPGSPTPSALDSRTIVTPPFPHSQLSLMYTHNVVFAYIVFNEFCLELAGLCCEHSVSVASVQPQFEKTMELERCLADF